MWLQMWIYFKFWVLVFVWTVAHSKRIASIFLRLILLLWYRSELISIIAMHGHESCCTTSHCIKVSLVIVEIMNAFDSVLNKEKLLMIVFRTWISSLCEEISDNQICSFYEFSRTGVLRNSLISKFTFPNDWIFHIPHFLIVS